MEVFNVFFNHQVNCCSSARNYHIKMWPQQIVKIRTQRTFQNLESVDLRP